MAQFKICLRFELKEFCAGRQNLEVSKIELHKLPPSKTLEAISGKYGNIYLNCSTAPKQILIERLLNYLSPCKFQGVCQLTDELLATLLN